MAERYDGFEGFVAERGTELLRLAVLLGGSTHAGEDLLQQGLERLLRHWGRIDGDPEGYLRRTLYRLAVDRWRRRGRQPEALRATPPDVLVADPAHGVDVRDALGRALSLLPRQQRTVIVLRHWEHLTEAETAAALGCSVGAVKSASSRGLARLRAVLDPHDLDVITTAKGTHDDH